MSNIAKDGLTQPGTAGCFIAVPNSERKKVNTVLMQTPVTFVNCILICVDIHIIHGHTAETETAVDSSLRRRVYAAADVIILYSWLCDGLCMLPAGSFMIAVSVQFINGARASCIDVCGGVELIRFMDVIIVASVLSAVVIDPS